MKKLLLAIALFMGTMTAFAQGEEQKTGILSHVSVGIGLGTTGIDIEAATTITSFLQVRAGMNFVPNAKLSADIDLESASGKSIPSSINVNGYGQVNLPNAKDISAEAKLNFNDFHLLADLYPSKNSSFHITAGFYVGKADILEAYNTNRQEELKTIRDFNHLEGQFAALKPYESQVFAQTDRIGAKIGDNFIEPDENGEVRASLRVKSFKPYLGIGFGRAVPRKNRISCQFNMGVQFWGSPKIMCNGQDLFKSNSDKNSDDVYKAISKANIYPVISLRLNGRIF